MIGHVVTLLDHEGSVACAKRCIASGAEHGFEIEMWAATKAEDAEQKVKDYGLPIGRWKAKWSHRAALLGNFCSQYRLWSLIADSGEPQAIFEHDAVITAPLPDVQWNRVLQVGRPSFGPFESKRHPGVYELFSKPGGYFGGAHAYLVSPEGAKLLVAAARKDGAQPADSFFSLKRFPWLQELWPWIAHVEESFSTIQKKAGCLAKHQFRKGYTWSDG